MCGFVYWRHGLRRLPGEVWAKATGYLRTRGPDARQTVTAPGWALGFARLAIIDLSPEAMQPFADATGRHLIALNGEIYNYAELRAALAQEGVTFRSHSDTEVLLELIVRRGLTAALEAVRGMFSFVWIDTETDRVVAVRDQFGQKPLYWFADGKQIGIASDQRSLNALRESTCPNIDAYHLYLCVSGQEGTRGMFGADTSMFAGLHMLPAGHVLTVDNGAATIRRYFAPWQLVDGAALARNGSRPYKEVLDEFGALLKQAVARHLVADVPVGVLLSGGLDSTAVYWYAHEEARPLSTFTKLSPGIEKIPLEVVPRVLEARPAFCYFRLQSSRTYLPQLQAFVAYGAAPSRWGGGPPMHDLCAAARRNGIFVLLGGDCADEYLGGYGHYRALLPRVAADDLGPLVGLATDNAAWRGAAVAAHDARERLVRAEIVAHLTQAGAADLPAHAVLLHDTATFLQSCNLPHSDAYSMMASVELRNPMLDLDLVRFALNLPIRWRAAESEHGGFGKRVLRDVLQKDIGPFMSREKEGTRNYAMAVADPRYWRLDAFSIGKLLPLPVEPTRRDVIRMMNLELFHRLHIEGDADPLADLLRPAGHAATDLSVKEHAPDTGTPAIRPQVIRPLPPRRPKQTDPEPIAVQRQA